MKTSMIPGKLYCPAKSTKYYAWCPSYLWQVSLDNKPLLPVLLPIPLGSPCLFVCHEGGRDARFLFDEREVLVNSGLLIDWEEWTDGEC